MTKTLIEQINQAAIELKAARRDGFDEWIARAVNKLDELIDELPRGDGV